MGCKHYDKPNEYHTQHGSQSMSTPRLGQNRRSQGDIQVVRWHLGAEPGLGILRNSTQGSSITIAYLGIHWSASKQCSDLPWLKTGSVAECQYLPNVTKSTT
jgi:hypothetical protein